MQFVYWMWKEWDAKRERIQNWKAFESWGILKSDDEKLFVLTIEDATIKAQRDEDDKGFKLSFWWFSSGFMTRFLSAVDIRRLEKVEKVSSFYYCSVLRRFVWLWTRKRFFWYMTFEMCLYWQRNRRKSCHLGGCLKRLKIRIVNHFDIFDIVQLMNASHNRICTQNMLRLTLKTSNIMLPEWRWVSISSHLSVFH